MPSVSLSSYTMFHFRGDWHQSDLLRGNPVTYSAAPFEFRVRARDYTEDSKGFKVDFELELRVLSPTAPALAAAGSLWAKLAHRDGVIIHGFLDAGSGRCRTFWSRWSGGDEENGGDASEQPWDRLCRAEGLRFNKRTKATGSRYSLDVQLWLRPDSDGSPEHTETLPLYFSPDSPLPSPFLPYSHHTQPLITHLTSTLHNIAFTVPNSLAPDSPRRTFFAHRSVFSPHPYFAALFADPSGVVARRSSFRGRSDLFQLIGVEEVAAEKSEEEEREEGSPGAKSGAEEDTEMTPVSECADGEEGEEEEAVGALGDGEDTDEEKEKKDSPAVQRSSSPSPEKPAVSSIRTIDIPHFTAELFELLHAHLYEMAATGKASSDFGRLVECFLPDSKLEDQILEALEEKLTDETVAALIFSPYVRYLPRYRVVVFNYIKDNVSEVRQSGKFKALRKEPKTPEWKGALWAELADLTQGEVYKTSYW
ncbi:hypothetical protein JCM6882_000405 [Rhodosporidiobolus microsporus]